MSSRMQRASALIVLLCAAFVAAQPLYDASEEFGQEEMQQIAAPPSPREIHEIRARALATRRHQHHRRNAAPQQASVMNEQRCQSAIQENTVLMAEVHALKQEIRHLKSHNLRDAASSKKKKAGLISHRRGALRHRVQRRMEEESNGNGEFPSMSGFFSRIAGWNSQPEAEQSSTPAATSSQEDEQPQVESLKEQLQKARMALGRSEEEKTHLQDRLSDLESSNSEKDSELAADSLKEQNLQEKAQASSESSGNATKQEEEQLKQQLSQEEALTVKEKADAETEKEALEAKLDEKDQGVKELSDKVEKGVEERAKLQQELRSQLSGEGVFAAQKFEAERKHEEDTLKSEATELESLQGTEGKCMDWGKRLEVKLQRVLTSRRNDARLCRDGILSLHSERSKLHEQLQKMQATVTAATRGQAEAEKSSTEDQNLLSRCLDEVQQFRN